jgi:hypothetical protein
LGAGLPGEGGAARRDRVREAVEDRPARCPLAIAPDWTRRGWRRDTGAFGKSSRLAWAPPSAYRGPQQAVPGCPTSALTPEASCLIKSSRKRVKSLLLKGRMAPHRALPGCPARTTGAPDKDYRGAQQKLPGCPTKTTGVPSKNYRGARQGLPGCPTKTTGVPDKATRGNPCKKADFLLSATSLCIVMFSCCFV